MGLLRTLIFLFVTITATGSALSQIVPSTGAADAPAIPAPSPNDVKEFLRLLGDPSVQEWIKDSATETGQIETGPAL
ncbi:MAG: hypothetical protein AAF408_07945, partial [Pseudomonadota bacterium]